MEGNLTFATRSIGLFWRENGSCSSRLKESQWVSEPLYGYFRRNRILDEGLRSLKRRSQCTMTATKPSKKCALVTHFFFASFLVSVVVMVALTSLVAFPRNTTISPEKPTIWLKTRDGIDVRRYARDTPVVEWKRPYSKKKSKCWIT